MQGFFPSSRIQQGVPTGIIPKCGACGLYKTCQSPKMPPYGEGAKRVLVVGEAPGETEDDQGRPFVGKAGAFLRDTLRFYGIKLDRDALTTNSLICRPPNNKTPDLKQIEYCRPNLLNTIGEFKPRVILTLGRSALVSVLEPYWKDVDGMERWAGWKIPLEDFWVCPTYHPSYLMRMQNPLLDRIFASHLEAAFSIEEDPPQQEPWDDMVDVLYDDSDVEARIAEVDADGDWVAVDYETNCLKPEYPEAEIVSCAMSNGVSTFSYLWTKRTAAATSAFLQSKRTRKIASNLKFEERWSLVHLGHGVRRWGWDTMLATHCLDNRPDICSVKFQALVRLGVPAYNRHVEPYLSTRRGPYNRVREADVNNLLFYGGMDAILEHRLAMLQRKDMGYGKEVLDEN